MAKLSVRDLLSRDFVGVSESDTVLGAVKVMREDGETGAVVLRGSEAVGVVSAGDILDTVADEGNLDSVEVAEVMQREPPDITPQATVDEAASILSRAEADHLLVTNEDGVVGVVSVHDLATIGWESGDRPEAIEMTAQGAEMVHGENRDTEYSNQSICEVCGSLSRDLVNVNGQLLCADCRSL